MASIVRRESVSGVSYQAKVRVKGAKSISATFPNKTLAKEWAKRTEIAIKEGRYFPADVSRKHTLCELVDKYTRGVLLKREKDQSARIQQLGWWKEKLGHSLLADVTPAVIGEWRDELAGALTPQGTPRMNSSVNRYLAALSHCFTIGVNEYGWLQANPVSRVRRLKEPRGRTRYLSEEEVVRLLQACRDSKSKYLYTAVVISLCTGMRRGELLGLTWDDVDLKSGLIMLEDTKNDEPRQIPLSGEALTLLRGLVRRIDSPLVFPGIRNPLKPASLRESFNTALKRAKIEGFNWHDLRHTAASYLVQGGESLVRVGGLLGHKSPATTKRYAHLSRKDNEELVSMLSKKLFEKDEKNA